MLDGGAAVTVGQAMTALAGAFAVGIGIWLLRRNTEPVADKPSEARMPLVSFSGPPGLLLALVGLFLIVFPFTPWWPTGSASEEPPSAGTSHDTIRREAEEGAIASPMEVRRDDSASGGAYVATLIREEGAVTLEFEAAGGRYFAWGRVAAPEGAANANSVHVSVDGEESDIWDFFQEETDSLPSDWQWERLSLRCGGDFDKHNCDPWSRPLSEGRHTLVLHGREADSRVDVLVITNDPEYTP